MISFYPHTLFAAVCALVLLRVAHLYALASRKIEPVRGALLQRIWTGGERGFLALTCVLVLSALGGSARDGWKETFLTGPLGVEHAFGILIGFQLVLARLERDSPYSSKALRRLAKEAALIGMGSVLIASFSYPSPVEKLLHGVRVIAYPALAVLLLLNRRARRVSEDFPAPAIVTGRPAFTPERPTIVSLSQHTTNHQINIRVENHYHITQQILVVPKEKAVQVHTSGESAQARLLAQAKRTAVNWSAPKQIASGVVRRLLGNKTGEKEENP